jgi:AraC-like DNA-binding protein
MKSELKPNSAFRTLDVFDSGILHGEFPQMNLFQMSPGAFEGWVFSAQMENCKITAGSFNQEVLVEGHYNPDTFHVGFILSPGHSAVVQAHEYDNGTLTVHRNAIALHEVFPAKMAWVDIAIPEKKVPEKLPDFITKRIEDRSRIFLTGSRETLAPIVEWVNGFVDSPDQPPLESELQAVVRQLLADRLDYHEEEQQFTRGDRFRMHLIKVTHELVQSRDCSLSLSEICEVSGMKPRTLQKYFNEIYGMGPTEYFRTRRLNRVRSDLQKGLGSVSEVALRWGFNHLGRFSGRYKNHFAEMPRTTLNRKNTV